MRRPWLVTVAAALVVTLVPTGDALGAPKPRTTRTTPTTLTTHSRLDDVDRAGPLDSDGDHDGSSDDEATGGGSTGGGLGNIIVGVPGASIAPGDNIEAELDPGHTYRAVFHVWVAANAQKATFRVQADGARISHCSSSRLRSGAVTAVKCQVRPSLKAHAGGAVTLTLVVRTKNFGWATRTYRHSIEACPAALEEALHGRQPHESRVTNRGPCPPG